jgi:hypothetical protein
MFYKNAYEGDLSGVADAYKLYPEELGKQMMWFFARNGG